MGFVNQLFKSNYAKKKLKSFPMIVQYSFNIVLKEFLSSTLIVNCILCKIQFYKRLERKMMKFEKSNEPWINAVTSLSFVLKLNKNMWNKKNCSVFSTLKVIFRYARNCIVDCYIKGYRQLKWIFFGYLIWLHMKTKNTVFPIKLAPL